MKRSIAVLLLILPVLFLAAACDDDDNPAGGGNGDAYTTADTPEKLITRFAEVYDAEDSTAYEALLDSLYIFELNPNNIDPEDPVEYWGREDEIQIARRMFSGWTNADGQHANSISLALGNITPQIDNTSYGPDLPPEGETWYRVTCFVDLRVEVTNPQSPDGVTLFLVACDQEFVVRPDPDDPDLWVVFRQYDKESYNKIAATEEASWGAVKGLFRERDTYTTADTPEKLITRFAEVYDAEDSTAYEELLDSLYIFELDPNNIGPGYPVEWWDREDEIRIAGRMFGGWQNPDGQHVNSIDLALSNITKRLETTSFGPDLPPEGETWYRVTCSVDLRVEVENPQSPDGVTLFLVASDQEFVVRPDPNDSGGWVVFRQYDKEPYNKIAATDNSSWGSVKQLWR
ncbi:MAG: hypothetical protein JW958_10350 [Candidatus Eisenbacteria bacterium]|nr:hypothetical protein [Candidatus Eisenbacteria bacterium]